jgi:ankyrin repeat protein
VVKVLLTKNANIEAKTNMGKWTPLICGKVYLLELYLLYSYLFILKASKNEHQEAVKLLLAYGANIEASDNYDKYTPLLCGN